MNTRTMKLLWLTPLCLIASIGASLLAVWVVSKLAGFSFDPSIVVVLSGAGCAAVIAICANNHRHG
jgi:hypothetical protein